MVRAFRVSLDGYVRCFVSGGTPCGAFPEMNGNYYCIPVLPFTGDSCRYEDGPLGTFPQQGELWNVYFVFSVANGGTVRMGHELRHPSGSPSLTLTSLPGGGSIFIANICEEVANGHQLSLWPVNNVSWVTGSGCASGCVAPSGTRHFDARFSTNTVFTVVN